MKNVRTGKKRRGKSTIKSTNWASKKYKTATHAEPMWQLVYRDNLLPIDRYMQIGADTEDAAREHFAKLPMHHGHPIKSVTKIS